MNLNTIFELNARYALHGHQKFNGLDISIETDKGRVRKGVSKDGKKWSVTMTHPYGYIRQTKGVDGDHVDCFIGPDENAKNVYVMHVTKGPEHKSYDEDKCMLGFSSAGAAKKALLENYSNPKFFGSMDTIPFDQFKTQVLKTKTNPQKLTKMEEAMQKVAAEGEPNTYGGGKAHYDPMPTFHPPSLKKPQRVPADNPGETDDRFLDVTKRKAKSTQKFRKELTRRNSPSATIPGSPTAVNHHTAVFMPFVTNG